jgi:surfeit locus 1 family protein
VFVLTPFALEDGRIFVVNRGWAAWPARTAALPDPRPPSDPAIEIRGVLADAPGVGAQMGQADSDPAAGWPRLQTWFDPAPVATDLGTIIPQAVIRLAPDDPAHLTGDAWQLVSFGPERHRGYALTWAAIAFVVGLIWLTLSFRQFRAKTR